MKEIDLKQIKSMEELKKELGNKYDEIMYQMNLELLNRMEKAIEYIKENKWFSYTKNHEIIDEKGIEDLLEILKGEDKE